METVAREEGIAEQEVQERFAQLSSLLAFVNLEKEGWLLAAEPWNRVSLVDVVRLVVHAPADIMSRAMALKAMFPNIDVSTLVARCPKLLETDVALLKAELNAVEACIDGVPREMLEQLIALAPADFLLGNSDKVGQAHNARDSMVCACCKEARRLFDCKTDLDAVQKMVQHPSVIFQIFTRTKQLTR
eukprot:gnl/MRDRNA2_/MRDRNA2_26796_c0_seq1.p1 gnl/MRDRNA2_/MRDRNA2_26796_c0~~gnl/MRDRNA2_/MRDRNA2_26796_c0_seq1.p1  ORF type:complete len:188 (+),score=46.87 gnl/MRDRNA2_/MRDRNA2_26796_c0_seq1:1-564(+)